MISTVEKIYNLNNTFELYKVVYENNKVKFVPLDESNSDYQKIQQWITDGGTVVDNPPE